MCVTTEAIFCTVRRREGEPAYLVVVAEEEGYALVRAHGGQRWAEVKLGDLDQLDDAGSLDAVVDAVLAATFEPAGGAR
jgi:hypothetical protein